MVEIVKRYCNILLCALVIVIPLLMPFIKGPFQNDLLIFPIIITCLLQFIFLLISFLMYDRSERKLYLSKIDICVGLFLGYVFLQWLFGKNDNTGEIAIFRWLMIVIVYLLSRIVVHSMFYYTLVVSSLLQAVIAIMQKLNCFQSEHPLFDVTGTFNNPGPLAGYLATGMILAIFLLTISFQHWRSAKTLLGICSILIISIVLYWTDSRSGLLAIVVGIFIVYRQKIRLFIANKRILIVSLSIAAVLLIGFALWVYRPASANARLLIWRVSCDMVVDKPIYGHGIGGFDKLYMFYQAKYFANHPHSRFLHVSDNVAFPYNEFMHIVVDLGLVGLVLLLLIVVSLLFSLENRKSEGTKAALSSCLVFAMFSYPSYVAPLLMNFVLFTGIASSRKFVSLSFSRFSVATGIVLSVVLLVVCFNTMSLCLKNSKLVMAMLKEDKEVLQIDLLRRLPPSCENFCKLGDYYIQQKQYELSESYYKIAANMIPTRMRPNYKLWNLYLLQNDTLNARSMARYILDQPLKVENSFTLKVKRKIRIFLHEDSVKQKTIH